MKRIVRNLLITVGFLLIAGIVSAIDLDFNIVFPWDINTHCFDDDYWDSKNEHSLGTTDKEDSSAVLEFISKVDTERDSQNSDCDESHGKGCW